MIFTVEVSKAGMQVGYMEEWRNQAKGNRKTDHWSQGQRVRRWSLDQQEMGYKKGPLFSASAQEGTSQMGIYRVPQKFTPMDLTM
jgi:hypothetical protein